MVIASGSRIDVEALRCDHPVADVIAGYGVALRHAGRALIGRCPFHADGGRPNLHVYPATQSWYCYRCQVGGDVVDFVRRRENLGFLEACHKLAGQPAGSARSTPVGRPERHVRRWDRLTLEEQVTMNIACILYQRTLWREPRALAYLRGRGIPDWVIRAGALGFADGHSLEAYLRRRSGLRTAQELGLLRKPERADGASSMREFFAGRIVMPEIRGSQCSWLIGRTIDDNQGAPKYLALPGERPVLGLERAAGRREAFLCEGVFDYLTAITWRLPAFSPCGTALPDERMGFLATAAVVYGVLDADDAGRAAAERFGEQLGRRFRPLSLPEGCDLNDLGSRPSGRAEFFRLLADARAGLAEGGRT